jgi:ATP:guanido phosphotransferase, N-terminal domain
LKTSAELVSFPKFPEGTKSLLSKYLTPEVWNKLHDLKDKYGFSFKDAIFSGCKNTDSGIGVYAGSRDSYIVFADLFDKIIEKYHGHLKENNHVSDMDYTKLECPPFLENEAALIKSTRIRVGRNLKGYPLGPGLTKE